MGIKMLKNILKKDENKEKKEVEVDDKFLVQKLIILFR